MYIEYLCFGRGILLYSLVNKMAKYNMEYPTGLKSDGMREDGKPDMRFNRNRVEKRGRGLMPHNQCPVTEGSTKIYTPSQIQAMYGQ